MNIIHSIGSMGVNGTDAPILKGSGSGDPLKSIDKQFKYNCNDAVACGRTCFTKECVIIGTEIKRRAGDGGDGGIGGEGGYAGQIFVIGATPTMHNNTGSS